MTLQRTTIVFVAAAALAAWFSAAMTPARPPAAPPEIVPRGADAPGAALAREIARLRDRLHPDAAPREGTRNPFVFRSSPGARRAGAPSPRTPANGALIPAAASMRLTLAGIAEDPAGDGAGVVRTAIISGDGQLFLAKTGDVVTDNEAAYTVGSVLADSVELIDAHDGSTRRLTLK
jgi:hypothetical protein